MTASREPGGERPHLSLKAAGLEINVDRRAVLRNGHAIHLTRTEWRLLEYLAASAGRVVLNKTLLTDVWGPAYRNDLQYLRVWVSRLRRKLEEDPSHPKLIKTKQGVGYLLDIPPHASQDAMAS